MSHEKDRDTAMQNRDDATARIIPKLRLQHSLFRIGTVPSILRQHHSLRETDERAIQVETVRTAPSNNTHYERTLHPTLHSTNLEI